MKIENSKIVSLVIIFFLVLSIFSFGAIGIFLKNINLYLFGTRYFIYNILGIVVILFFFLKKRTKKKYITELWGMIIVSISLELILSFINITANTNTPQIATDQNKIGIIQAFILKILDVLVGNMTIGVLIIGVLIGLYLVIGHDRVKEMYKENQKKIKKKKKEKNKIKEDKLDKKLNFYKSKKNDDIPFYKEENKAPDIIEKDSGLSFYSEKEKIKKPNVEKVDNLDNNEIPSLSLLEDNAPSYDNKQMHDKMNQKGEILIGVLSSFKLNVTIVNILIGPTITKYELQPELGVKVSKFSSLSNDLAMALSAKSIRIEAPIPGKSLIGIEVPNETKGIVSLKSILDSTENDIDNKLQVALGQDVSGNPVLLDIAKTPHLLVAGSTGSGKSVCINSLICSILLKATHSEVKLLMIDPKKVELTPYDGIPHLLAPVITDPKEAAVALNKLVHEMEKRYELFAADKVKNISGYNNKNNTDKMPYIVAIIDELADLMLVASADVETSIARLAQMARAAGIHLIIATQRPSTDVITGLIKANIPSRIAFMVSSSIDSRTILDSIGAEKLLGHGDMLLSAGGSQSLRRIQGTYVKDEEITKLVDSLNTGEETNFFEEEFNELNKEIDIEKTDPLIKEAINIGIENNKLTISLLQRRLKIGYNRAANLIEELEELKVVSEQEGNKPRKILINSIDEVMSDETN